MTASLLPLPRAVFYDANGNPLAGGLVNTYVPGGTTPKTTWQDSAQGTPNSNPIVLDAAGSCLLYGNGSYQLTVTDSLGNAIPAYSGVTSISPGAGASGSALLTASSGTFTVPAGIFVLRSVQLWGGGAQGGGSLISTQSAGGGGGGAMALALNVTVTPAQSCPYVVGAGGAGSGSNANGVAGGNTTITVGATTYTAGGGPAGMANGASSGSSSATNGMLNISGGNGNPLPDSITGPGGLGGSSPQGGSGGPASSGQPGNGVFPGGGGAGGGAADSWPGGLGAAGAILIQW